MEKILIEGIKKYLKVTEGISSAGQPDKNELSALCRCGFEVVINLGVDNADYALKFEREFVENSGMEYIHIPVTFDEPMHEDYKEFKLAMNRYKNNRVFVHCAENKRVSVFLAIYFIQEYDWNEAQAIKMINKIWQPNPCWDEFFKGEIQNHCQ